MSLENLKLEVLQQLPGDLRAGMAEAAILRRAVDGERLFEQGDASDGVYAIISGVICFERRLPGHSPALIAFAASGTWFGEVGVLESSERRLTAFSRGNTQLLFIPRIDFLRLLDAHPLLQRLVTQWVAAKLRFSTQMAAESRCLTLQERLARALLELQRMAPRPSEVGQQGLRINFSLTQDDLASLMGVTRQRINQILRRWQAEGLVETRYRQITLLQPERLSKLSG
jgi:CRP-like cAMP-binding protein